MAGDYDQGDEIIAAETLLQEVNACSVCNAVFMN